MTCFQKFTHRQELLFKFLVSSPSLLSQISANLEAQNISPLLALYSGSHTPTGASQGQNRALEACIPLQIPLKAQLFKIPQDCRVPQIKVICYSKQIWIDGVVPRLPADSEISGTFFTSQSSVITESLR